MPFVLVAIAALSATELLVVAAVVVIAGALLLSKKMNAPANTTPPTTYVANPLELTIGTDVPRRMVYGMGRISGVVVYANISGDGHEFLWFVVVIAAHKIHGIDEIYFDGVAGPTQYAGYYDAWYHMGDQTTADATLMATFPEWTNDCVLNGCAYAVVKLKYDKDVWKNGRPNITFDVKGKEVYDPRDGTTVWSDNAALCLADYMTSPDGLQALTTEMDWDTVAAAATVSGELPAQMAASLCDGRYTINGVVEMSSRAGDIIDAMATAMAGTIVWTEGKYRMFAGAVRAPVARPITAEDLRDSPTLQPRTPADQSFNCVKGTFLDQTNNWQFSDFPPVIGDAYVTQDGGVKVFKDVKLQFTTSPIMAQRLATVYLRRARLEKTITLPLKWSCFNYEVWDVISLNLPALGWVSKLFQVTDWKMTPPSQKDSGGIELTLVEYTDDIFNDDMSVKPITGAGTIIVPDVGTPNPLSVLYATSDSTSVDANGAPRIRFDWPVSPDIYAVGYDLAYGIVPFVPVDADYQFISGRTSGTFYTPDMTPGETVVGYIRVRNSFDRVSTEIQSAPVVVQADPSQYPEDLHGLTASDASADYVDVAWASPTGNPVQVEVRWSPDTSLSHAVLCARVDVPQNTVRLLRQSQDGYYFAAFISTGGLYGNWANVFDAKRVPGTPLQTLTLDKGKGDLTHGVWVTQNKAVSDSQSQAVDLGWELFDNMVYNPYPQVTYKAKAAVFVDTGHSLRVSGTVGRDRAPLVPGTLPVVNASAEVAYFASTENDSGAFTLSQSANIKLEFISTSSDPQGVVFTGFSGLLEQTA